MTKSKRKYYEPTERAREWAKNLKYNDRLLVQDFIFRLYSLSEDMRMERGKK